MPSPQEQASRLLDLPTADFFRLDEDRLDTLQRALAGILDDMPLPANPSAPPAPPPPPLLALGAPHEIAGDPQTPAPVLVGSIQSGQRAWEINFRTNLWLVLRSLFDGTLTIVVPFNDMKRGESPLLSGVGTPPGPVVAATVYSAVSPIDLRAQLDDPLLPGLYVLTAVAYDLHSNSVELNVDPDATLPLPRSISPQPYLTVPDDADAPLQEAIHLPEHVAVGGPIRLAIARRVRIGDGILRALTGRPVWPCHALLLQADAPPVVVPAAVPVRRVPQDEGEPQFNAMVEIDLRMASTRPLHGAYQVYVDVGRALLGPYPMQIEG